MSKTKSNAKPVDPAFPVSACPVPCDGGIAEMYSPGMSLRDYFAAKAMHAELLSSGSFADSRDALVEAAQKAGQDPIERIAILSYEMADAMLKARALLLLIVPACLLVML